jgi:hypothetical protein
MEINNPNIKDPAFFQQNLQSIMQDCYQLFELAKESDLSPVSEDGVTRYFEESGKCGFQVAGQYERPSEFLQCLLDIIRVQYEPNPMGTLFLNSNIGFAYENMPASSFQLGYISLMSEAEKAFDNFWLEDVHPYITKCGYHFESAFSIFAVASTGHERYNLMFLNEIADALQSGFSVEEAFGLLKAELHEDIDPPRKQVYSGYCLDEALGTRIRLSLWMFLDVPQRREH